MISIILAMLCGYGLAANVRQVWIGLLGCIVGGFVIGAAATYGTVYMYEHSEILKYTDPIDHARIPDAIIETAIRFVVFALMFYGIGRLRKRRNAKKGPSLPES
jgi:hypothetical protein